MQNPLSGQEFGKYQYDFGKVMLATVQTPQAGGPDYKRVDRSRVKAPCFLKTYRIEWTISLNEITERQEAVSLINPTRLFMSVGIPTPDTNTIACDQVDRVTIILNKNSQKRWIVWSQNLHDLIKV